MIGHPLLLLAVLCGLVAGVKALSRRPPWDRVFDVLPVPFWCYMLPMAATAAGLFPSDSPLYGFLSRWALPVCLMWVLLGVDVHALKGAGLPAFKLMAAGSAGLVTGTVAASFLLKSALPDEAWKALGALAATWTGGTANLIAVKEALAAPESVIAPVVVVDGLFTYGWMSLLVAAAGFQSRFDRWSGASSAPPAPAAAAAQKRGAVPAWAALACGVAAAVAAVFLSPLLPRMGGALSPAAWAVLLSTTGALAAAFALSRSGRAVPGGVEKTGAFLLLVLMASMGARSTLQSAARAPVFLAAGALMLASHAGALLLAARLTRAPLSLAATASQACLGGVISAPMVGAVYSPALAAVGLLLAVAANAVGTYIGLLTAVLCRWVAT